MNTYILVDTANTFFRARHVVRGDVDTKVGMALHITFNSIKKAWQDFNGTHVVFCLEGRSWRKDFYEPYKRNRQETRDAMTSKEVEEDRAFWEIFDEFKNFVTEKTNCTVMQHPRLEADDFGNINNLGIYGKNPEAAQILNLNMRIMNSLASRYPDVFTIEPSRSQENTYRVLITPRVKPEETVVDNESDLANSMRVYAQTVEANRGLKPKMFIAGNYTWALNKNNLYNLMDKLTGFTFLKNVDLETGSVVPETVSVSMPVSEEKVDKMFRQIMGMIKHEHMADLLAVQGIDTRDIYEQLRDAKTEADLNKINETLLKALC